MKQEKIYDEVVPVKYWDVEPRSGIIRVRIIKTTHKFLWWSWNTYQTKVTKPYIDCCMDGQYSSKRYINHIADLALVAAENFLIKYKNGCTESNRSSNTACTENTDSARVQ